MWKIRKDRSKFGEFIDEHLGYGGQERIRETTGLSRFTINKACADPEYMPTRSTANALLNAIKQLIGKSMKKDDFWPM